MFKRTFYLLAFFCLFSAGRSFGQEVGQPDPELKDLIRRAALSMSEYKARFKDLTAEEEQKVEEYDKSGKLKKHRRIASDLFVYQSQLDPNVMVEYRDVKSVDGVAVKKREARLLSLLNKSARTDSLKKELERITRESRRYDLNYSFYGMTLNQGLPLYENARESFDFKLTGREQVNGQDAFVIEYRQVSLNAEIAMKLSSLPAELKGAETRYRGRLWLDAETAQIRREVRETMLEHPSLSRPLLLMRFELDYADSRFGLLTPQRITISTYNQGRTGADKKPELLLGGRVTFEYGAFTRFNVETPDASVTPPAKP
jgi:hypothetical protein